MRDSLVGRVTFSNPTILLIHVGLMKRNPTYAALIFTFCVGANLFAQVWRVVRMNYSACPYASPLQGFVQIAPSDLVAPTFLITEV